MVYTGNEISMDLAADFSQSRTPDLFEIRPLQVRNGSEPIFDEDTGSIIGYRYESGGFWIVWDLEGNVVDVGEVALESPLIDPIEILAGVIVGLSMSVSRILTKGGTYAIAASAGHAGARALSSRVIIVLHSVFRKLISPNGLKFTKTTAARMIDPARRVPVQYLRLAIREGKAFLDPQGVVGAVKYTTPLWKNGVEYTLEVVVRVKDSTVLHFLYQR